MSWANSLTLRLYGAQGDQRPITLALQLSAPVTSRDRRPARRARGGLVDIRKIQKRLILWITCTCLWTAEASLHLHTARLGYPQGSRLDDRMEFTSHLGLDSCELRLPCTLSILAATATVSQKGRRLAAYKSKRCPCLLHKHPQPQQRSHPLGTPRV